MSAIFNKDLADSSSLKLAKKYSYNSATRCLTVKDYGVELIVSIFNKTNDVQLYTAGSESYSGTIDGSSICHDRINTSLTDGDEFIVLYKPIDSPNEQLERIEILLREDLAEQKKTNMILVHAFHLRGLEK